MNFKDYFSRQSKEYSKYRPTYPEALFEFLNRIVNNHDIALDCATGNGQAAKGLTRYFNKVIAIDASNDQIKNAFENPKIEYQVAKAEQTGLDPKSVDLITVATAVHWLDIDLFYEEVRRVLKDDGVIAIWTYLTTTEITQAIDELINTFSNNVLQTHWDDVLKAVGKFEELDFPFKKLDSPEFEIRRMWHYSDYINYMFTWSSIQSFIEVHNSNPLHLLEDDLKKIWGENTKREVTWKIKMKAGRKDLEFGN